MPTRRNLWRGSAFPAVPIALAPSGAGFGREAALSIADKRAALR
jgi:hypothetical protein